LSRLFKDYETYWEDTMNKKIRMLVAGVAAPVIALATAGVAAATASSPEQLRCGYYESGGAAYYGHCDEPPRTDVIIHVDTINDDYDLCVMPGLTVLGSALATNNAWYTGQLCWAG
jgi:hypothetical protein